MPNDIILPALAVALAASWPSATTAQNFPVKPVRIVTSESGGGSDQVAREIARGLTGALGQQVIVDNRGRSSEEVAARALPDGYTLLVFSSSLWLVPLLRPTVSYDVMKDFAPIT